VAQSEIQAAFFIFSLPLPHDRKIHIVKGARSNAVKSYIFALNATLPLRPFTLARCRQRAATGFESAKYIRKLRHAFPLRAAEHFSEKYSYG